MAKKKNLLQERTATALSAIKDSYGTHAGRFGATMFVKEHVRSFYAGYWNKRLGTGKPRPEQVLDALELDDHWGEEDDDGADVLVFTLPGQVTDQVLTVNFDADGKIDEIVMES